ncbi:fimbrial protein [Erwinia sp. SLM-02]|uniref:fimbrial protein n=1 Tax=Erwinia sp. SLM-02 TaxID=3020057 RepID=UPI0028D1A7FC|nr:fimbrial protein [uncultured Erwinia sp.]
MNKKLCLLPYFLLATVILLCSARSEAFSCIDKRDGRAFDAVGQRNIDVTVNLSPEIMIGDVVIFDLANYFQCQNTIPNRYVDYMRINAGSYQTSLDANFSSGLEVQGVRHLNPITSALMVYELRDGNWHDLQVKAFYQLKDSPGKGVYIKAGTVVASLQLYKWSAPAGGVFTANWRVLAANDAYYTSGTCAINNSQDIDVNFGLIARDQVTTSAASSPFRREVTVPYQCKDTGNWAVKMTLSADASAFSSSAVKTSNPDLGVEIYHQGKLLKPFDSINSQIVNGVGSDDFTFSLVGSGKSEIATGPFTGSAVLVMSLQ